MLKAEGLEAELARSGPPRWLVATGAEEFLRAECRAALERQLGAEAEVIELDAEIEMKGDEGPTRIFDELRSGSLFTAERLVVIRNAALLVKGAGDALARFAAEEKPQALVMLEDDDLVAKKAKKLSKPLAALDAAGALIVDCNTLYASPFGFGKPVWDSDLSRWVAARARGLGKKMSLDCAYLLHSREASGLRGIAAQLDKLALAVGERVEIRPDDVEAFVGGEKEASLFEVVDAFALRDGSRTMAALARLYRQGLKNQNGAKSLDEAEVSMRLIALVAGRLRELGRILESQREGKGYDEAAAAVLGANRRWLFPKFREQLGARSARELGSAVVAVEELEHQIKSGGDPRDLTTFCLYRHSRPARPAARRGGPFASQGR